MELLTCTCGSTGFWTAQSAFLESKQSVQMLAICMTCAKDWTLTTKLSEPVQDNVRDAGPQPFAGRNIGVKRDE